MRPAFSITGWESERLSLTLAEWALVAGVAIGLLTVVEIGKWISNIFHNKD